MKKILKFKCDYLTQDEYSRAMYFIKELSPNHFDKYDWGDRIEYYFMEEALEVTIDIETLSNLSKVFSTIILEGDYIKIKNTKGEY